MRKGVAVHHRISVKVLAVLLTLFSIAAIVVSMINQSNLRRLYEENCTERVLLTNALMAITIDSSDVNYFVGIMKNQDEAFKQRQVQYYYDRLLYWDLQEEGASEEELADLSARMTAFHHDMAALKTEQYWKTVDVLRHLKSVSNSTYLYVMADTGVVKHDGEPLYTFIFDADDNASLYEEAPDVDGLGTSDISQATIKNVYDTKQQMDYVEYYNDVYGELYYAYAPILNRNGDVIAVFATDLDLGAMNDAITSSTLLFNTIFFAIFIAIFLILFLFLHRSIVKPLGGLTSTAHELAEGNIYAGTPESALRQRSEMGVLAHAVNDMSLVYQDMIGSAGRLFAAAKIGRLGIRSDASAYKGDIRSFIKQINDTLDATTLYLNSIPESIFIMSTAFEIHFRNHMFVERFGDMPARDILTPLLPAQREEGDAEPITALLRQEAHRSLWINGACFSMILKEITLDDTAENSILVIAIDITDLMREKENAQAAAKAKSDFLSRMSHEMRTPMNAIIGMTKIAETSRDVAKLTYCLAAIDRSSRHLLSIINDVLDMSRIEAGKLTLERLPLDLEAMLAMVCGVVREDLEKKRQTFHVRLPEGLVPYLGDELRLSQVITNLLSNAIKFTPEDGEITLSVEQAEACGGAASLRFTMADTGIGMSAEQLSRLWDAFEQADGSVSRRYGGTGLGLAISKHIVESMGGQIWVESAPGAGSTFHVAVCLERAPRQDAPLTQGTPPMPTAQPAAQGGGDPAEAEDLPNFSGAHVLLAEDVAINREIALALLEPANLIIDCAANGAEAVALFLANPAGYDLILMDIQMPEVDGLTATKRIRASGVGRASTIPIVAMTANVFREDVENCLAAGMNDHVGKPIDQDGLFATLATYLGEEHRRGGAATDA